MRLSRIRIRNFRCYQQELSVDLDNLTVLVGKNDMGKSAILDAMAIFFEEAKLDNDDPSVNGNKSDVRVICEFEDFPEELIIDVDYPTTLKDEHLLNSDGRLEIHKIYNGELKTPKITGVFAYAQHPSGEDRNDLLSLKNTDLRSRAADLNIDLHGIDQRINTHIRRQIWDSVDDLELQPTLVPLDQEAAKKIWTQLSKYMPSFAIFKSDRSSTDQDIEAQDPMKAAINEALKEKENELNEIAKFVKQEVGMIASETVNKLREMDSSLANELHPRFSPPRWANVFKVSLTGDEEIPINKRGSGVRRLILLNFLRAKAEQMAVARGSTSLIYAIEEPETSQHPNNQKMLLNAFCELAEQPDCQVIITTHTPMLGRFVPVDTLRYICEDENSDRQVLQGNKETYCLISKALGVLPDHSVKLFIGVEGRHDINFLRNLSKVLVENGEDLPDLNQLEKDGSIVFFPLGGSNLALWVSRLEELNRPEFYLFDRDVPPPNQAHYQSVADEINKRDGCTAILTGKKEIENYLHPDAIKSIMPNVETTYGDFDNVPALVAKIVHENSGSPLLWEEVSDKNKTKKISHAKVWLNSSAVLEMTPEMLSEIDQNDDVRGWLNEIERLMNDL